MARSLRQIIKDRIAAKKAKKETITFTPAPSPDTSSIRVIDYGDKNNNIVGSTTVISTTSGGSSSGSNRGSSGGTTKTTTSSVGTTPTSSARVEEVIQETRMKSQQTAQDLRNKSLESVKRTTLSNNNNKLNTKINTKINYDNDQTYNGVAYTSSKTMAVEVETGKIATKNNLTTSNANLEDHYFIKKNGKWVDVGVYDPKLSSRKEVTSEQIENYKLLNPVNEKVFEASGKSKSIYFKLTGKEPTTEIYDRLTANKMSVKEKTKTFSFFNYEREVPVSKIKDPIFSPIIIQADVIAEATGKGVSNVVYKTDRAVGKEFTYYEPQFGSTQRDNQGNIITGKKSFIYSEEDRKGFADTLGGVVGKTSRVGMYFVPVLGGSLFAAETGELGIDSIKTKKVEGKLTKEQKIQLGITGAVVLTAGALRGVSAIKSSRIARLEKSSPELFLGVTKDIEGGSESLIGLRRKAGKITSETKLTFKNFSNWKRIRRTSID